jgi:TolA-binding protein
MNLSRVTSIKDFREEFAKSIKYGHEQQLRAQDAESECQKKDVQIRQLQKEIEQMKAALERKAENDVFNEALSENYENLKRVNNKLTERCATYKQNLEKLVHDYTLVSGSMKMANYVIKLQRMLFEKHGIDPMKDKVFAYMIEDVIKQISVENGEALREGVKNGIF